jgi:hypothetical protein
MDRLGLLNGVDVLGGKGDLANRSNTATNSGSHSTANFGSNSGTHSTANIRSLTIPNLSDSSTNIFVSNSGSNSGTHCGPDDKGSNTIPNACSDSTHKGTNHVGDGCVLPAPPHIIFFACVPSAPAHPAFVYGPEQTLALLVSLSFLPHTARRLLT